MKRVWFWLAATWIAGLSCASLVVGQEETEKKQEKHDKAVTVKVDGGKIVIVGEDGQKQEIDVSGAKSIIVNRTAKSKIVDGQEERKVVGKAIVVDDQGNTREIEFGDDDIEMGEGKGEFEFRVMPRMEGILKERLGELGDDKLFQFEGMAAMPKFFIGVQCTGLNDEQRAMLELEDEGGLIVVETTENSPAQGAGLKADDVLLLAGETALTSPEVLIKAVQEAGEQDKELKLTIIREGKEQQVKVKPAKRSADENQSFEMAFEGLPKEALEELKGLPKMLERVGPGIIRGHQEGFTEEIQAHMEEVRAQMDEVRKQMHDQMEEVQQQMRKQMDEMREQFKQMRKEMEKMNRDK